VKRLSGFRALVSFDNGSQKEIDLEPYLNGPVFEAIRDQPAVFRSMKIAGGTIAWEGGADIDPDVLRYGLNAAWAEQSEATRREPKRSESGVSIDETAT
jgi:hypothetical protein